MANLYRPRAGYGFGRRICPGKHIAEVSSSSDQPRGSQTLTVHLESPRTALPLYRLLPPLVGSLAQAVSQPAIGQGGTPLGRRLFRGLFESPTLVHVQDRTEGRVGARGGRARVAGSGSGEGRSQVVRGCRFCSCTYSHSFFGNHVLLLVFCLPRALSDSVENVLAFLSLSSHHQSAQERVAGRTRLRGQIASYRSDYRYWHRARGFGNR